MNFHPSAVRVPAGSGIDEDAATASCATLHGVLQQYRMQPACDHAAGLTPNGHPRAVLNVFPIRPDARPYASMHVFGGEKRRGISPPFGMKPKIGNSPLTGVAAGRSKPRPFRGDRALSSTVVDFGRSVSGRPARTRQGRHRRPPPRPYDPSRLRASASSTPADPFLEYKKPPVRFDEPGLVSDPIVRTGDATSSPGSIKAASRSIVRAIPCSPSPPTRRAPDVPPPG
jgi:hypothetical protein